MHSALTQRLFSKCLFLGPNRSSPPLLSIKMLEVNYLKSTRLRLLRLFSLCKINSAAASWLRLKLHGQKKKVWRVLMFLNGGFPPLLDSLHRVVHKGRAGKTLRGDVGEASWLNGSMWSLHQAPPTNGSSTLSFAGIMCLPSISPLHPSR